MDQEIEDIILEISDSDSESDQENDKSRTNTFNTSGGSINGDDSFSDRIKKKKNRFMRSYSKSPVFRSRRTKKVSKQRKLVLNTGELSNDIVIDHPFQSDCTQNYDSQKHELSNNFKENNSYTISDHLITIQSQEYEPSPINTVDLNIMTQNEILELCNPKPSQISSESTSPVSFETLNCEDTNCTIYYPNNSSQNSSQDTSSISSNIDNELDIDRINNQDSQNKTANTLDNTRSYSCDEYSEDSFEYSPMQPKRILRFSCSSECSNCNSLNENKEDAPQMSSSSEDKSSSDEEIQKNHSSTDSDGRSCESILTSRKRKYIPRKAKIVNCKNRNFGKSKILKKLKRYLHKTVKIVKKTETVIKTVMTGYPSVSKYLDHSKKVEMVAELQEINKRNIMSYKERMTRSKILEYKNILRQRSFNDLAKKRNRNQSADEIIP